MELNRSIEQEILEKLKQLAPERLTEVEDFVDFLRSRDEERSLTRTAAKAAEPSFAKVWDNDADADHDRL